jgi:hypothetical protein
MRFREASSTKPFSQSSLLLPGIGSKAKRNPATRFHDLPHQAQRSARESGFDEAILCLP